MNELKLHVGCGRKHIPGMIHVDIEDYPHVDMRCDVRNLNFAKDNTINLIYACHVLEHFGRYEYKNVLREWYRVLKPGGLLRLAVPDFQSCCKLYYENGLEDGLSGLIGLISGGQRNPHDYHKMIFDEQLLARELRDVGFREIARWDWKNVEHGIYDDYSQSYLPHMDKENGTLMSLNLEAQK